MRVTGGDAWLTGLQWFFANVLGVCILFPLGMTVSLRQFAKLQLERRFLEALTVFALLGAVSVLGFRAVALSAAIPDPGGGDPGHRPLPPDGRGRGDDHHQRHRAGLAAAVRHRQSAWRGSNCCNCSWR